jgi:hypothetical protein
MAFSSIGSLDWPPRSARLDSPREQALSRQLEQEMTIYEASSLMIEQDCLSYRTHNSWRKSRPPRRKKTFLKAHKEIDKNQILRQLERS